MREADRQEGEKQKVLAPLGGGSIRFLREQRRGLWMMTGWEGTPGERCNAPRKEGSPPLVCTWPPVSGRARAVIVPTLQRVWRPGQGQGQNRPLGQPCRTRLPCFSGRTCNLQNGL